MESPPAPQPQNDFASLLTNLGSPPNISPADLAILALRKNHRRIRRLSALTIGMWIITFLLVPSLWMPFAAQMKKLSLDLAAANGTPAQVNMKQVSQDLAATNATTSPLTTKAVAESLQMALMYIAAVSGIILAITTIASLLAAISTVWLVLTVRRVTLEQLTIGLTQIAEELHRLQKPPA